ncbi:MAG: UbiH/UbiF/VisC/COQ6 family ubiquinone biosynthesis hydroxylase [Alphaproteobacteria bacterium]|nr:UbiH/UbiF/VisC/COQ6 family ubiquinone biosynthesis hydroxylase [Alphaproteobacteria bacterium]
MSSPGSDPAISADVVIIGGGLVGLTLARALGSAGLAVTVVDRERPARAADDAFDGRASAIAWGSAQVLRGLGLWEHLAPHAEPIRDIRVSDGASLLFLHYDHREAGLAAGGQPAPLGYIVENRFIRRALYAALAETTELQLMAPADVVGLDRGAARVEASLTDGRRVRASLAIACDGRESPLRAAAGIEVVRWRYEQVGIVSAITHERPHHGIAHERFLSAGPLAILPLPDSAAGEHQSSIVWTERAALAPLMLGLRADQFAVEIQRRFGDGLGEIHAAGRRWSYPLGLVHAKRYTANRLVLAGDAAHAIHPIAGQGLNLGLRDVAALAECIVDAARLGLDVGLGDALARYERWRRFDNLVLAATTDGLNRLFSNDVPPVRLLRDVGLGVVNRVPAAKRLFMRHAMGLLGDLPRLVRGEAL